VSDLFILFRTIGIATAAEASLVCECFLFETGGEGRRVEDSSAEGNRECVFDDTSGTAFLARVGSGKLLNVLLRGMPPIGSSGRQM